LKVVYRVLADAVVLVHVAFVVFVVPGEVLTQRDEQLECVVVPHDGGGEDPEDSV